MLRAKISNRVYGLLSFLRGTPLASAWSVEHTIDCILIDVENYYKDPANQRPGAQEENQGGDRQGKLPL